MKKIWLYHRESTEAGAEQVETRFTMLREYAEKSGYEVMGQSFDLCDWRDTERPGLDEAVEAIRSKTADTILCVALNRIARDRNGITAFATRINNPWALQLVDENDNYAWWGTFFVPAKPFDQVRADTENVLNPIISPEQFEAVQQILKARNKTERSERAEPKKNDPLDRFVPLGYDAVFDEEVGRIKLVPNQDAAKVKEYFEHFLNSEEEL